MPPSEIPPPIEKHAGSDAAPEIGSGGAGPREAPAPPDMNARLSSATYNARVMPPDPSVPADALPTEPLPTDGLPADPAPAIPARSWARVLAWPFWNGDERRLRALWRVSALVIVGTLLSRAVIVSLTTAGVARQDFESPVRSVVMVLITLATVALAARLFERRGLADFGLRIDRAWLADLGFGAALGALLMSLIFTVESSAGWITARSALDGGTPVSVLTAHMATLLLLFVAVAINEEVLFRGYLLRTLAEGLRLGPGGARAALAASVGLTSAVFGVAHLSNPASTWVSTLGITGAGLLLASGYVLTGRLGAAIGLHITWNFFQGPVYGFPVSGMQLRRTTLTAVQQGGPDPWTGGAFGPEAGLLGVLAIGLGLLLTLIWVRWREGRLALCTALVAPPARRARAA